jgi:hypothetical protein
MKLRLLPLTVLAGAGCSTLHDSAAHFTPSPRGIREDGLRAHIAELSSDRYEGRGPGTPGEQLTVDYLRGRFEALGLQPGNPDGN